MKDELKQFAERLKEKLEEYRLEYGWEEDRLLEPKQIHLKMTKHEMRVEILKLRKQLEEYQSKIENGTLIELPCKVEDKIYACYGVSIEEWEVVSIQIYNHDILFRLGHKGTDDYNSQYLSELGDVWFLTEAEAEQKLKEQQNESIRTFCGHSFNRESLRDERS